MRFDARPFHDPIPFRSAPGLIPLHFTPPSHPTTTVGQPTFSVTRDVPSALRPPSPNDDDDDDDDDDDSPDTTTSTASTAAGGGGGASVLRFDGTVEACRDWLHGHGVRLVGVEIGEAGARDVEAEPFEGPTALLLGNEVCTFVCDMHGHVRVLRVHADAGGGSAMCQVRVLLRPVGRWTRTIAIAVSPTRPHPPTAPRQGTGMSARQIRACDGFVYIAQFGKGTASLNVAVAGSIVMHRFGLWWARRRCEGEGRGPGQQHEGQQQQRG